MTRQTKTTDAKGRVVLPKHFANATVILEEISDCEIRIRRAQVIPEDEVLFREDLPSILSNRDRDVFLAALDNPPAPNTALRGLLANSRKTTKKARKRRGA